MKAKRVSKKIKQQVSFSTTLSKSTKDLLDRYCSRRGIRLNHFVEQALLEALEDEVDKEIIDLRENEETVIWKRHG